MPTDVETNVIQTMYNHLCHFKLLRLFNPAALVKSAISFSRETWVTEQTWTQTLLTDWRQLQMKYDKSHMKGKQSDPKKKEGSGAKQNTL